MNVEYNELTKFIKIKDNQKFYFWGLIFMLLVIIANSILNGIHFIEKSGDDLLGFLYILTGIVALIFLIYQVFKKSITDNLNINEIDYLIEKKRRVFGLVSLSIKFKNGKIRNLSSPDSESKLLEIKKLFDKIGLTIKQK